MGLPHEMGDVEELNENIVIFMKEREELAIDPKIRES